MNLRFKMLNNTYVKFTVNSYVLNWDKENTYCTDKNNIGNDWIVEKMIAVYNDEELIGLGSIMPNYTEKTADLSSIIKPEYRKKGIATLLLKNMLNYCKDYLKLDKVRVNILKTNLTCIDHIEKNNFDFVSFDETKITYEKKLINKK